MNDIERVVAALGPGTLCEEALRRVVDPLFSGVLQPGRGTIYLADRSLGRPFDLVCGGNPRAGLLSGTGRRWTHWREEMLAFVRALPR